MKSTTLSEIPILPVPPVLQGALIEQHRRDIQFLMRRLRAVGAEVEELRGECEMLSAALLDEQARADRLEDHVRQLQEQRKAEQLEIAAQLRSALITQRDMLADLQEFDTRHADALRAQFALVQKIEATMMMPAVDTDNVE
jgi:hypothetical protein